MLNEPHQEYSACLEDKHASEMRCRSGVCFDAELEHDESRPTAMKRDEQQVIDLIENLLFNRKFSRLKC
jgi:hypothetical protein